MWSHPETTHAQWGSSMQWYQHPAVTVFTNVRGWAGAAPGVDKWPSVVYSARWPHRSPLCTVQYTLPPWRYVALLYWLHIMCTSLCFIGLGSSVPTYLVNVMSFIINAVYTAVSVAESQCPCCRQLGNKSLSTLQQPVAVPWQLLTHCDSIITVPECFTIDHVSSLLSLSPYWDMFILFILWAVWSWHGITLSLDFTSNCLL